MNIHILSDLHRERFPFTAQRGPWDLVILAGDIDEDTRGIHWARHSFDCPVIYIAGNHEYFGGHLERTRERLQRASDSHVQFLEESSTVLGGIRFLGVTAWTDFSSTGDRLRCTMATRKHFKDFQRIRAANARLSQPYDFIERNLRAYQWLRAQLAQPFAGPTVVITHHAPSLKSMDQASKASGPACDAPAPTEGTATAQTGFQDLGRLSHDSLPNLDSDKILDGAFANRWDSLMNHAPVLWVHGHTHVAVDYRLGSTRILCNPKGSPKECTGFQPGFAVAIPVDATPAP